ncbi:calcium-translocating P-type ATPase(PMCA-type),putative [Talaromyces proteolyticus]|uniref:Calcium-transporting ATPase n=1 Tax=Talaromyces proteolyticus TaxID=1131652 RepID=A0AAD4KL31_9EURO|nr:calcium-translocating P-type ATPase(PMCA-type),putative [Talaromyces proteolyticus]KAH8692727.1 calcium-translocating P-type ATPase(PMCA-type),putative [Talaromyces proteolyticus]
MSVSPNGFLQLPGIRIDSEGSGINTQPSDRSLSHSTPQGLSPSSALSSNSEVLSLEGAPSNCDRSSLSISRPSSSLWDAATLRDRSASFASTNTTLLRSRADSTAASDVTKCVTYDNISASEALKPDPRYAGDFVVEDNNFAFSPGHLNKMLNPKSLPAFLAMAGPNGLSHGLRTDLSAGLSIDETKLSGHVTFEEATTCKPSDKRKIDKVECDTSASTSGEQFSDRIRVFGRNVLPDRKTNGFFKLFWEAYKDKIIILLTIAAVVSISLGVYEALSGGSKVDWIEGVAISVAILLVTIATAANDWQKERQFARLNKRKEDRQVKAIRSGKEMVISVFDVVVGDILHLEPGDSPPADGVFISGHGVKCDESSATGESDAMDKTPGREVWQQLNDGKPGDLDPFIISGSKVLEGVGTYLVTSVGPYSSHGRIMASLQTTNELTPLQVKLGKLADWIGWLGSGAAAVLFLILLIQFLTELPSNPASPAVKGQEFMDILIVAVTVIVVAVPEGLPLAVTLALAFATTRMVKENNLVRVLRACETMGNATVICSDKTGTLTQNKMTVVASVWGYNLQSSQLSLDEENQEPQRTVSELFRGFSETIKSLVVKSIALNSTAFEDEKDGKTEFIGSKTEVAMLQLAKDHLGINIREERANSEVIELYPFNSSRKCMAVVYRDPSVGYRLLVKGAAELMLASSVFAITTESDQDLTTSPLTEHTRHQISNQINQYAKSSLRTIAMVYRDFSSWPPTKSQARKDSSVPEFESIFNDMTWIGVVGIQDPLRPEVPAAIKKCNNAGVQVKMVTGDNLATATAIATACGIKTEDGLVMEGPEFRQLSDGELDRVVPHLQVLARSSPDDKRILVERLKHLGEIVAVTGDGTNDGPALKTANVGFSMGICGTEVAKEASSIILLDDNFKSIVTAIAWGRAVNDAVAKFLQFQITVNITAVILTFVSSIYSGSHESVLSAVQLLWVNLIMDTFAALALATDGPTDKILDRKPTPKNASLFTMTMWKMIIGQSIYKLAVTFTLYFAGKGILGSVLDDNNTQLQLNTIIFNTFVWMQIFNELNNRRLDNKFNIFEGILRNYWFLGINCIIIGGQILIIFVGGMALGVTPLNGVQWAICLLCGVGCLPWGVLLRLLPDRYFAIAFDFAVSQVSLLLRPFVKGSEYLSAVFKKAMSSISRLFMKRPRHVEEPSYVDEEAKGPAKKQTHVAADSVTSNPPPITVTTVT